MNFITQYEEENKKDIQEFLVLKTKHLKQMMNYRKLVKRMIEKIIEKINFQEKMIERLILNYIGLPCFIPFINPLRDIIKDKYE